MIQTLNNYGLNDIIDQVISNAKILLGDYWESNINKLTYRINWNKHKGNVLRFVPFVRLALMPVSFDEVERIVACYMNLVLKNNMIEYDRKNNPSGVPKIEKAVSEYYGQNLTLVKTVLYSLYYATKDGTMETDEFLRPRTYNQYVEIKEKPETEGNMGEKGFLESVFSMVDILTYVILIGVAIIGGFWIYNNINTIGTGFKKLTGTK